MVKMKPVPKLFDKLWGLMATKSMIIRLHRNDFKDLQRMTFFV